MQALETAAFAAWPSALSTDFNGWQLRLDRGYTKRANSANATAQAQPLSNADLDAIESRFGQLGLTPTFRLTSFAPVAQVDALLERRGYRFVDRSLVMTRPLGAADDTVGATLTDGAPRWLQAYQAVSGKSGADQAVHLEILRRIANPCAWAVHGPEGSPVCCGLGVVVEPHLGLFDIATRAGHLRQGLARQLCRALLGWGWRQGARTAFLQVVADNAPAIGLYQGLGFEVAYQYWYRVPRREVAAPA
jgi:ribosomal protein S18 acetylase RimI-like enzyme